MVLAARHLDRAERLEMVGHELSVEQREAAGAKPCDQMHQRHLRGVARAMEHTLAEERAAEAYAVEPADEFAVFIGLDAVAMADAEELFGYCSPCQHCEHFDRGSMDKNRCKLAPSEESIPEEAFFGKWVCLGFSDIDS